MMARFIGARGRGPWAGANRCQIDSVLPQMLGFVPARKMRARAWIAANLVGWLGERGARAHVAHPAFQQSMWLWVCVASEISTPEPECG
jgi:hypothetical protein